MKNLYFILALLSFIFPLRSQAFSGLQSKSQVRARALALVTQAVNAGRMHSWIESSGHLSRFDKQLLLNKIPTAEKVPEIRRRISAHEIVIAVKGIELDLGEAHHGIVKINGLPIEIPQKLSLMRIAQLIDEKLAPPKSSSVALTKPILARLLLPGWASAGNIEDTCIGDTEFMFRSPFPILDSRVGYIGKLFVSSIVMGIFVNPVIKFFSHCEDQADDLNKLLADGNIGIKEIDCGTEDSGNDRSIEFWMPERAEDGVFKTRSFNLDYALSMAQEKHEEEEKGEKEQKLERKKPELKSQNNVYIFGTSELQEVRVLASDFNKNEFKCETTLPSDKKFAELKSRIEPFRKVFQYIGDNNSCMSCKKTILKKVRTPKAPTYFPAEEMPAEQVPAETPKQKKAPKKRGSRQNSESAKDAKMNSAQ